jgi:hypothetical protein
MKMSIHSPEVRQRVAALMAVARDGRRTRQVREAAVSELKELKAQKQQGQQRRQAERTVTAVSPSVAPVSVSNAPKPSGDVKDATPAPDSQDNRVGRRERLLAFKEHVLVTDSDAYKLAWVEDRLREMDKPEPVSVSEPQKPAEKSDWQKLHEYFHGEPVDPTPPPITVDFAGFGIPEQGAPDRFWDKQFPREAEGHIRTAQRLKPAGRRVVHWSPGLDFDDL